MTTKPKPPAKPDDPEQSKRFIDMGRQVEVDEKEHAFEAVFERFIKTPPKKSS